MNNIIEFTSRLQKTKFTPAKKPEMVDVRLVHSFIEWLMFLGEDDSAGKDSQHRLAEFWSDTSQREQARHLFEQWLVITENEEIYFEIDSMFNYDELKTEINAEFKAKHGRDRF